jgi:hypothetical protein
MKRSEKKPTEPVSTLRLEEPYRLVSRYFPRVFVPCNAVDNRWRTVRFNDIKTDFDVWIRAKFITTDGKIVRLHHIAPWNNCDHGFDAEFDEMCKEKFGMPFSTVQSQWFARLRYLDGYWDLIDLELVDDNA